MPLIDGGTYRLPRIVGLGRALDLILTGREIDAAEAWRWVSSNRVVPDGGALDAAVETGRQIAASPWSCVVHDRPSVYEGLGLGLEEALANEDRHGHAVIFVPGFADGVARFSEAGDRRRGGDDGGRRVASAVDRLHRLRRRRAPPLVPARGRRLGARRLVAYRCEDCLDRWDLAGARRPRRVKRVT